MRIADQDEHTRLGILCEDGRQILGLGLFARSDLQRSVSAVGRVLIPALFIGRERLAAPSRLAHQFGIDRISRVVTKGQAKG